MRVTLSKSLRNESVSPELVISSNQPKFAVEVLNTKPAIKPSISICLAYKNGLVKVGKDIVGMNNP